MSPIITTSHILANDIFKAKKIDNSLKYLDLTIDIKREPDSIFEGSSNTPTKNLEPWGIYCMFFKKNLIYIGSWCGNYDSKSKRIEGSVAKERWKKHIITDTTRFQNVTFCRDDDRFDEKIIQNVLRNRKEKLKTDKYGRVTLNTAIDLYREKKVDELKYQELINSKFLSIKNKIKKNYYSSILDSKICEDIGFQLNSIKYNSYKEYQKILAGGSMAHSPNRFKISAKYWEDFKKRNEKNIFGDFEFVYFKFENFIEHIPKDFLYDGLIKDGIAKKKIAERFRCEFEKKLIYKFSPPANDDKDKGDKNFKFSYDISIIDNIKRDLEIKYKKQNLFYN